MEQHYEAHFSQVGEELAHTDAMYHMHHNAPLKHFKQF